MSPETKNAHHVCPNNPVTDIEIIHEVSACSVSPNVPVKLLVMPLSVSESDSEQSASPFSVLSIKDLPMFPVPAPGTVNALSVCVLCFNFP